MDECPCCLYKFETEAWVDGQCPNCGNKYVWDSAPTICWKSYKKIEHKSIAVLPLKDIWKNEH